MVLPYFQSLDPSMKLQLSFLVFFYATFNGFREDFGWFGYLLPHLQVKWNALVAGLINGVFWSLIHLGNWLLPPGNARRDDSFLAFALQIILVTLLYVWLFNNSGGKLIPVMLAHALSNSVGGLIVIPDLYLQYQNWVLLTIVISVVLIFGRKKLVRQISEDVVEKEEVHAMSDRD